MLLTNQVGPGVLSLFRCAGNAWCDPRHDPVARYLLPQFHFNPKDETRGSSRLAGLVSYARGMVEAVSYHAWAQQCLTIVSRGVSTLCTRVRAKIERSFRPSSPFAGSRSRLFLTSMRRGETIVMPLGVVTIESSMADLLEPGTLASV